MTWAPSVGLRPYLAGIALGVGYGVAARFIAGVNGGGAFGVMTIGFLIIVPVVIGYLVVRPLPAPSVSTRIFAPWPACVLTVCVAALTGMEGAICIILALPLMLLLSSVGGLVAGADRARTPVTLPILVLLPYVVAPFEHGRTLPLRLTETRTTIDVAAPPDVVWPLVASVDSIRPEEERPALFTAMGFPHPVSAVIDRAGVGGIRQARFTGGLVFVERVTEWDQGHRLRFTIRANTKDIPPTTLDPHVTIGGPYFDVLTGTYELVPLPNGGVRVVLSSEHRVSTPFNLYAGLWTNAVMQSIQSNILAIIKARAERACAGAPASARCRRAVPSA